LSSVSSERGRIQTQLTCPETLAIQLEAAARIRRVSIAEHSLPRAERDWLFFLSNSWDADQWRTLVSDPLDNGKWVLPEWWQRVQADAAADLRLTSAGDPAEPGRQTRIVAFLLNTLQQTKPARLPLPLPETAELDWLDLADRMQRFGLFEHRFDEALEAAKLDALREFAYGASHEINNPLANISGRAQALMVDEEHPDRRRTLATIAAEAFRAHDMIGDIMLVARPPALDVGWVDAGELLDHVLTSRREPLARQQTEIRVATNEQPKGDSVSVRVDKRHVLECLQLLVDNAADAIGQGGVIELQAIVVDDHVELVVQDDGPGIPDEVRSHIFEPYFSGREAGRGLGIGLSKCWVIARQHGGVITCHSKQGCTRFVMRLPIDAGNDELGGAE
jgi:signal transduction histidine kinase